LGGRDEAHPGQESAAPDFYFLLSRFQLFSTPDHALAAENLKQERKRKAKG